MFAMGTMAIFLCLFLGNLITAQSVIKKQGDTFFQDVPGFFDNIVPLPFKQNFDFTPFDTIFSSRRTLRPDFHMLAELPPIVIVPRVQVFCDENELILLVDKRSNGVSLNAEELQLGDGCYSNSELLNQYVFTYGLDECGTTPVMQNGSRRFTNSLHLNLKRPPPTWLQTPSTVHLSCVQKRSYPNFFDSTYPENSKAFNIKAMNPSWARTAESNIYKRGQVVNLQVSTKTRAEQQLFIQSCFVSASPEPHTRSRHAVIMNKGCTAPLGSPHAVVQFVASNRADLVNFVLNTSYLISELYVHCSVLVSDQGVNFGSKSCNYNMMQSRWEDLGGNVEVCRCCSSKCKGLPLKQLPEGAKATVSIGPLVIVDKPVEMSPEPSISEVQETYSNPLTGSIQSAGAANKDAIVSGTSVTRPPQGVVVVSQDPFARLTLWLPGQVQDPGHSENIGSMSEDNLTIKLEERDTLSNDLPELQTSATVQRPPLNTPTNDLRAQSVNELGGDGRMWDLSLLTLVDGWAIPPENEKPAFVVESQGKGRFGRSGLYEIPLAAEMNLHVLNQNDFNQMNDKLTDSAVMPQEEGNDAQPIIHTRLVFSKGKDGSQTLSYEEDVVNQQEGRGVMGSFGIKRKQEPKQRGLRSTFLDLLRRMDKEE